MIDFNGLVFTGCWGKMSLVVLKLNSLITLIIRSYAVIIKHSCEDNSGVVKLEKSKIIISLDHSLQIVVKCEWFGKHLNI